MTTTDQTNCDVCGKPLDLTGQHSMRPLFYEGDNDGWEYAHRACTPNTTGLWWAEIPARKATT